MAVILVSLTLTILTSRKLIIEKTKEETLDKIYNRYELTYREVLKVLKEEIISYATENNITKESIKIGNFNTSISEEIINGYKLDTKYLTVVSNNSNYDVYLGKKETITGNNKEVEDLLDIIDYKIEGNSYQETLSGKNLINPSNIIENSFVLQEDGSYLVEKSSTPQNKILYQNTEGNTGSYTLSLSIKYVFADDTASIGAFPVVHYTDGTKDSLLKLLLDRPAEFIKIKFTTNNSKVIDYITWSYGSSATKTYIKEIQLEQGTKATTYEKYVGGRVSPNPDYPQEVLSVGDKIIDDTNSNYGKYNIPINIKGKNLVNGLVGGYTNSDIFPNQSASTSLIYKTIILKNMKAGTYTCSFEKPINVVRSMSTNSHDSQLSIYPRGETINTKVATITLDQDEEEYHLSFRDYSNTNWEGWVQCEKGDTATDYEPYVEPTNIYLDNPLRKVDIYKDYIDYSDRSIVRGINEYVITGSEGNTVGFNWHYVGLYDNEIRSNILSFHESMPLKQLAISNYYPYMDKTNRGLDHIRITSNFSTYGYIAINDLNYPGEDYVDSFVSNLQNLYSSGVPVKVLYPVYPDRNTSDISLPKINTSIGTQTISIDTDIKPSNVEFTVIKKIKQL